ncbi:hypothetical protein [Geodermatophilus sp. SYSU D00710]
MVAPDDLSLACRLSGLSAGELWCRYLAMGGDRSRFQFDARLAGAAWPEQEDRYLAVVADEALRDVGLRMWPEDTVPVDAPVLDALLAGDDPGLGRTATAVLRTRAQTSRLTVLFQRCARARADARDVRKQARAAQRTGDVRGPEPWRSH